MKRTHTTFRNTWPVDNGPAALVFRFLNVISAAPRRQLNALLFPVLAALVPFGGQADEHSQFLTKSLDYRQPEIGHIEELVNDGKTAAAMNAWRDVVVNRLRRNDLWAFDYHDHLMSQTSLDAADLLVGRGMGQSATDRAAVAGFIDLYGIRGLPGMAREIDWLATDPDPTIREKSAYGTFGFSVPLVAAYWKSQDPDYLRSWFAITADFARRQKAAIERSPVAQRRLENAPWIPHAVSCLHQADRVILIIRSLGSFAKALPSADGTPQVSWARSLRPVATDALPAATSMIPASDLAAIVQSITADHPPLLLEAYSRPGELPNQRLNGLTALLLVSHLFPEIKGMPEVAEQSGIAMNEYLENSFHDDGGMLEQSLNYNLGDLEKLQQLRLLLRAGDQPRWLPLLTTRIQGFALVLEAIRTPGRELPIIGNNESNPPALWENAQTRTQWFASKARQEPQGMRPALAPGSCAFPYSGFYAMRRDREWDSPYLFFMNARPATGHHAMDNLAIEVHAFGRQLLVRAGPPFYTPKFLPADRRGDAQVIEEYFGERSSFKVNTVVVDGKSQCRSGRPSDKAYTSPIAERWHSSDEFDFVEGCYTLGYGDVQQGAIADGDRSVSHRRRVIFVRRDSLWIVTDTMLATDQREHEYTRVWKFPPRLVGSASGHTPVHGFSESEIILDSNGVHTADPNGPNLWIFNAGQKPVLQRKLFGDRNPYRGWYARYLGDLTPAVDVHSTWTDAGQSTQIALLWPRPDARPPPVIDKSQAVDETAESPARLTLKLADGRWISMTDTGGEIRPLAAGPVRFVAETLLAVGDKHEARGIVIGATPDVARQDSSASDSLRHDMEFAYARGRIVKKTPILPATHFRWSDTDSGLRTVVADEGQDHRDRSFPQLPTSPDVR